MKMNCLLIEDDVMEILQELEHQLDSGIICCRCEHKCDGSGRCALSKKNLLTDLKIFKDSYMKQQDD